MIIIEIFLWYKYACDVNDISRSKIVRYLFGTTISAILMVSHEISWWDISVVQVIQVIQLIQVIQVRLAHLRPEGTSAVLAETMISKQMTNQCDWMKGWNLRHLMNSSWKELRLIWSDHQDRQLTMENYTVNMYDEIAEKLCGVCKILDQLEDPNLNVVIK